MSPQETVAQKAERGIQEGRVVKLHDRIYAVRGFTRPYLVCIPEMDLAQRHNVPVASCTCEAHGVCWHLVACRALMRMERERASAAG